MSGTFKAIGNDISGAVSDVGTFFNRATDEGQIFSNPAVDIGIASAVALPFLAPELLPGLFGGAAATDAATAALPASFGAASDAFDVTGGLGPGLVGTAFDTAGGVPLAGLTPPGVAAAGGDVLPAASTLTAGTSPFEGTSVDAVSMGGDPINAVDATTGIPATTGAGGVTVPAAPAAPSFAQDLTSGELLAGTGVGGGSPVGAFGAAPGAAGGGNVLTDTLSGIGNFLSSPAGKGATAVAGLGGLGFNLYSGVQEKKALAALNQQEQQNISQAQQAQAQAMSSVQPLLNNGTMLTSYLTNNTLPPQFQSQIDRWVQSTKAAITQGYASRGQSDDPKQNSALQQDLSNVDQQALGLKANFEEILSSAGQQMITTANSLLATGLSATQLASEIPLAVTRLNQSLNAQMSNAISNFAAAINGSNRTQQPGGFSISLNPNTGAPSPTPTMAGAF